MQAKNWSRPVSYLWVLFTKLFIFSDSEESDGKNEKFHLI